MLEDAIRLFRAQRLSDADYLRRVSEIAARVRNRTGDNTPERLAGRDAAKALFGVIREVLAEYLPAGADASADIAMASLAIDDIIRRRRIVNWTSNTDIQNRMEGEIEDYLIERVSQDKGVRMTFTDIDRILERVLNIARRWYA
jgi:type I restriction enzyme R subunit